MFLFWDRGYGICVCAYFDVQRGLQTIGTRNIPDGREDEHVRFGPIAHNVRSRNELDVGCCIRISIHHHIGWWAIEAIVTAQRSV